MKCCHERSECGRAAQVLIAGAEPGSVLLLPLCCWHATEFRRASPVPTTERPLYRSAQAQTGKAAPNGRQ